MNAPSRAPVPVKHFLILFILASIWGSSFVAIKITLDTIPPLTMTAARLLLAGLILGVIMVAKGESLPRDKKVWKMCIWIGVFGNALPFSLISIGEQGITSSQTSILMAIMPLVTIILAHFFSEGERATRFAFLGVAIGFCGIVTLVGPSALTGLGSDIYYQLAVSSGAVSYGIATVLAKNMPPSPLLGRSVAVMICASALLTPAALLVDAPWTLVPSTDALWGTLYLGVLPTAVATLIYFHLISVQGAGFFAYINYLIPIMGVFWGAMLLGDTVSLQAITALGAIFVGLLVANYRPAGK